MIYIKSCISQNQKRDSNSSLKITRLRKNKMQNILKKFRVILEMEGHHDYPSARDYLILYLLFCFGLILAFLVRALLSYLWPSHLPTTMTRRWCLQGPCILNLKKKTKNNKKTSLWQWLMKSSCFAALEVINSIIKTQQWTWGNSNYHNQGLFWHFQRSLIIKINDQGWIWKDVIIVWPQPCHENSNEAERHCMRKRSVTCCQS